MITPDILFAGFLSSSLSAALILALIFLIRKRLWKRPSPKALQLLWMLALIKLLVPLAPESPVSVLNLLPEPISQWQRETQASILQPASTSAPSTGKEQNTADAAIGHALPENASQAQFATADMDRSAFPGSVLDALNGSYDNNHKPFSWLKAAGWIWLGGMLILSSYYLLIHLGFRKRLLRRREPAGAIIKAVFEAARKELGITKAIPVYEIERIRSPFLYGVLKPEIYIPKDIAAIADSRQLYHIFTHELIHYKRKDLWRNQLWMLAAILHWYNPLVWLAVKKASSDRETACDASSLEALGEREATPYGMTLLMLSRLLARNAAPKVNMSPFFNNKNELKERIAMISQFKKGANRLTVISVLSALVIGAVLLTNPLQIQSGNSVKAQSISSFELIRPINSYKYFSSLERANVFADLAFKVPDYLPEGYGLRNIGLNEGYLDGNNDVLTFTFAQNFGMENERIIELVIAEGNPLDRNELLVGTYALAPYSWGKAYESTFKQKTATVGGVQGIELVETQSFEKHEPEIAKSFMWQDEGVWYALQYYSENHDMKTGEPFYRRNIPEEEMEKMVRSFVLPEQLKQARYDGEQQSFLLYNETDLAEAGEILGFDVKFPFQLPDSPLTLFDAGLQRSVDWHPNYAYKVESDALRNAYRVTMVNQGFALNDELNFYQSKSAPFDPGKLIFQRNLKLDGFGIGVYTDPHFVYHGPIYEDGHFKDADGNIETKSQTYYLWEQNGIHYAAVFLGMDAGQEELLKALLAAPLDKISNESH
ncbi:M56 family metallopeptidase [Paenibacillus sp. CAU 1782]